MRLRTRLDKLEQELRRSQERLCHRLAVAITMNTPAAARIRELIDTALKRKALAEGKEPS